MDLAFRESGVCVGRTWMLLGSRLKIFSVVEQRRLQQLLGGLGRAMA